MPPEPLDYQRPPRRAPSNGWREVAAYGVFFVSAGISAGFSQDAITGRGTSDWVLFVFFGLCAIALPPLVRGR